jgi:hypothetical protein
MFGFTPARLKSGSARTDFRNGRSRCRGMARRRPRLRLAKPAAVGSTLAGRAGKRRGAPPSRPGVQSATLRATEENGQALADPDPTPEMAGEEAEDAFLVSGSTSGGLAASGEEEARRQRMSYGRPGEGGPGGGGPFGESGAGMGMPPGMRGMEGDSPDWRVRRERAERRLRRRSEAPVRGRLRSAATLGRFGTGRRPGFSSPGDWAARRGGQGVPAARWRGDCRSAKGGKAGDPTRQTALATAGGSSLHTGLFMFLNNSALNAAPSR